MDAAKLHSEPAKLRRPKVVAVIRDRPDVGRVQFCAFTSDGACEWGKHLPRANIPC